MKHNEIDDSLKHAGVLGMKWGKRKAAAPVTKRRMSNKELTSRIKRLRMEEDFERLSKATKPAVTSSISKLTQKLGTIAALSTTALTIYTNISKVAKVANQMST